MRTKFIWGQSLYGDEEYTGQSSYSDKVDTDFFILNICNPYNNQGLSNYTAFRQILSGATVPS
jgi:hypothetical protein